MYAIYLFILVVDLNIITNVDEIIFQAAGTFEIMFAGDIICIALYTISCTIYYIIIIVRKSHNCIDL